MPRAATSKSFASTAKFRDWLERHHGSASELLVRCWKSHAKERGLTYPQAVEEALCFGWIDGVRRALDDDSFTQRFTPRKPNSKWSAINIRKVKQLEKEGRMHASGLEAFRARIGKRAGYSFEERPVELAPAFLKRFRANAPAWKSFQAMPPWYRRTSSFWVMSAKRKETRERRFAVLLEASARGTTIPLLTRNE